MEIIKIKKEIVFKTDFKAEFEKVGTTKKLLGLSSEDEQQIAVFDWIEAQSKKHPILDSIYAIPNGSNKSIQQRVLFKRTGLKSGVWDIHVPIPRLGFAGLYIEMKWTSGLSDNQKEFHKLLKDTHVFAMCYTAKQAITVLESYLSSDTIDDMMDKIQRRYK
jgi:hypothetical protein